MEAVPATGVERCFAPTIEGLSAAQQFLERYYDSPRPAIIMDEIVSNIVRCSGARGFSIRLQENAGTTTMVFSDDGKPFDPTRQVAEPDVSAAAENRQVGGLGIFMVRKMSKSVTYRREGDWNILTVVL